VRKHRYRITLGGGLGEAGRQAFEGFKIESDDAGTVLVCDLDQSGLYGALNRIQSLGLELVALTRLADGSSLGSGRLPRSRHLLDVHEFQAQRAYPVQQLVQAGLVKVTGQDRDGRLDLHHEVGERLAGGRAERANHSYLVGALGHQGLLPALIPARGAVSAPCGLLSGRGQAP